MIAGTNIFMRFFFHTEHDERQEALNKLISHSSPRRIFFVMTLLAVVMASAGLAADNTVFIIASMLIAPVLYPLLSASMGVVAMDLRLFARSSLSALAAFILAVLVAALFGVLTGTPEAISWELMQRTVLTHNEWIVAVVAGIAASIATTKPQLNEAFPGAAIAISIVPPLSAIGLSLAWSRPDIAAGAALLLATNTLMIVGSSIIVFVLMGFFGQSRATEKALQKDERQAE